VAIELDHRVRRMSIIAIFLQSLTTAMNQYGRLPMLENIYFFHSSGVIF
jgi:hypothetical protein